MDLNIRVSVVAEADVVSRGLVAVVSELEDAVVVPGPVDTWGRDTHVDVVLYDAIALHHGPADDLVHLVKETDAAVVVVARELRPDLADQALEKGVDGLIALSASTREIHEVIKAAALGELMGDGSHESHDYTQNPDHAPGAAVLSSREADVIGLVAMGLSNEEISRRLFLSINTVKTYIRTGYRKIGVSSRTQAVGWAIQHGFSTVDP